MQYEGGHDRVGLPLVDYFGDILNQDGACAQALRYSAMRHTLDLMPQRLLEVPCPPDSTLELHESVLHGASVILREANDCLPPRRDVRFLFTRVTYETCSLIGRKLRGMLVEDQMLAENDMSRQEYDEIMETLRTAGLLACRVFNETRGNDAHNRQWQFPKQRRRR